MKFTGAQIQQFWDEWPAGKSWYHDFADLTDEQGNFCLELSKKYDGRELGSLCWQGEGPPEMVLGDVTVRTDGCTEIEFGVALKAWLQAKVTARVVVDVPRESLEDLLSLCRSRRWKAAL